MRPRGRAGRCRGVIRHLHREQFVPGDPAVIWGFFSTPRNLDLMTPPDLRFRIMGEIPPEMYAGQMIEYRIGVLPGVWTSWLTEITHVVPGEYFVDEQRHGPYRLWHHEHRFRAVRGGVWMTDHVTYDVGRGWLGDLVHAAWISGQLTKIFAFREAKVKELFPERP